MATFLERRAVLHTGRLNLSQLPETVRWSTPRIVYMMHATPLGFATASTSGAELDEEAVEVQPLPVNGLRGIGIGGGDDQIVTQINQNLPKDSMFGRDSLGCYRALW
ncbi:hypothetical protein BDM02DRAFT_3131520 [Thelephora ganbajun]|uniref:Uncharacterized protein n=1 Tax=Thelephora ganbajun TaxID=370292 RepID=A0ACB6Z5D8_THEGA|nr:hypothetical protein BDM02DRAFT_3131520 [Thelephora ganbajun]